MKDYKKGVYSLKPLLSSNDPTLSRYPNLSSIKNSSASSHEALNLTELSEFQKQVPWEIDGGLDAWYLECDWKIILKVDNTAKKKVDNAIMKRRRIEYLKQINKDMSLKRLEKRAEPVKEVQR